MMSIDGPGAKASVAVHPSLPRDSWGWIWPDTLVRVLPFWLVPLAVAGIALGGPRAVGLVAPLQGWGAALALGLAVGLPLAALAIGWRRVVAPRYRLPTPADQGLQTIYYLFINAPAEEIFWRGLLQTQLIRLGASVGLGAGWRTALGIAIIAVIFGAYHRLGNYPWRFNIAAMFAGALFGALYALLPGPSIVVPTIVHGLTTAGYLSWGDTALHLMQRQQRRRLVRTREQLLQGDVKVIGGRQGKEVVSS